MSVLVSGVQNGLVYALVGLAFVVVFRVDGTINLALGEGLVLGVILGVELVSGQGWPLLLALATVVLVGAVLGYSMEVGVLRRMRDRSPLRVLIVSFGIALVLQNVIRIVWSTDTYTLTTFPGVPRTLSVFYDRSVVSGQFVYLLMLALLVFIGWKHLLHRTRLGRDLRAVGADREIAAAMGIRSGAMVSGSYAVSTALVAAVGFVVSPILFINYAGGTLLAVKGLIAALVGGIRRPFGSLVGGLLLGLGEAATAGYYNVDWKDVTVFSILLVILLVRPGGLLPAPEEQPA